jgi:hypothetical protein
MRPVVVTKTLVPKPKAPKLDKEARRKARRTWVTGVGWVKHDVGGSAAAVTKTEAAVTKTEVPSIDDEVVVSDGDGEGRQRRQPAHMRDFLTDAVPDGNHADDGGGKAGAAGAAEVGRFSAIQKGKRKATQG